MKINIQIEGKQSDLNPRQRDRLRRTLTVIHDIGFDINAEFTQDEPDDPIQNPSGDKYPHPGYFIRMRKKDFYFS